MKTFQQLEIKVSVAVDLYKGGIEEKAAFT